MSLKYSRFYVLQQNCYMNAVIKTWKNIPSQYILLDLVTANLYLE
jgi:hypothetical protein